MACWPGALCGGRVVSTLSTLEVVGTLMPSATRVVLLSDGGPMAETLGERLADLTAAQREQFCTGCTVHDGPIFHHHYHK